MKKKSLFFKKGIFTPIKLSVSAEKLDDDLWKIQYEETIDIKDKKLLEEVTKTTKQLAESLPSFGAEVSIKGNKVSYTVKGSLSQLASMVVTEFLSMSSLGDMTLRDMILLAGIGTEKLKAFESAVKEH